MKSSNKLMALGIVFSIAVLIVIGTIVYSIINDKKDKGNEMFAYSTQQSLGKDDAPVKVVEFGDFKCPACRTWDVTVLPRLKEEYIDKGKVQLYFINFPFIGKDSDLGAVPVKQFINKIKIHSGFSMMRFIKIKRKIRKNGLQKNYFLIL